MAFVKTTFGQTYSNSKYFSLYNFQRTMFGKNWGKARILRFIALLQHLLQQRVLRNVCNPTGKLFQILSGERMLMLDTKLIRSEILYR